MDILMSNQQKTVQLNSDISMIKVVNQVVQNDETISKLSQSDEQSLQYTIKIIYKNIIEDELIKNSLKNQTSSQLIEQRIQQIIQHNLLQEKEAKIMELSKDNKVFQDKIVQLQLDNQAFASSISQFNNLMNNKYYKGNSNLQDNSQKKTESNKNDELIEQLMQKLSLLEEQYRAKEYKIQKTEKEKKIIEDSLEIENGNMNQEDIVDKQLEKQNFQSKYEDVSQKYQQLNEEFETLKYRSEYIGVERIREQEQYKLLIDQIYVKCKDKTHVLKEKYKQYKEMSKELQQKLIQSEKNAFEKVQQNNEIKQKLNELQKNILDYQRQIDYSKLEVNQLQQNLDSQRDEIDHLKKYKQDNNLLNKIGLNDKNTNNNLEDSQFMPQQSVEINQAEKEKLQLEAKVKVLNIKCQELEDKLRYKEDQQRQQEKLLIEKESTLNQQNKSISEINSSLTKEQEEMKLEIKRLTENKNSLENQFHNYKKQYKEQTKNKLGIILNQLKSSKLEINTLKQKLIEQINDTYGNTHQIIQNVVQFFYDQKNKLKEQYQNEIEVFKENIQKKHELQQEKSKAVMYEKELFYKKQIAQLEQKASQLDSKTQDEKNIEQNEQTLSEEKHINKKLILNMNGVNAFKNQFIKSECYSARSVDRNHRQIQIEQFKNTIIKNQSKYYNSMKNQISESKKKEFQILDEKRNKINNMKPNLRSIDFEESSDQFINSISSSSSANRGNNCSVPIPRNSQQDVHKIPEQIDIQKKEQQNRFKQNKFEQLMRSTNYANSQVIQNVIKNRSCSKNKQINNFMEINTALTQKSPSIISSNISFTNRNRSSTNHQTQSVDIFSKNDQSGIRLKNTSDFNVFNDSFKSYQSAQNSPIYKKSQIKEESKFSSRQLNNPNPSIFSTQKVDKNISSQEASPFQNNFDNSESSSQKCELSGSDVNSTSFKNQVMVNYFSNSPDHASKQQPQNNTNQLIQHISSIKDKSRSNTPTYLSAFADKSIYELKQEIIKQKQRLTISRNNSQEISSQQNISHSSNLIQPNNDQANSTISQFQIQTKYNSMNVQQNEQNDISSSISSSQQTPVKINLINFKNFKFVSPNQSKILQSQQQKSNQQSSLNSQNSKSCKGQQLEINDL